MFDRGALPPLDAQLMGDRCKGHCCKGFPIPYSPDEIEKAYAAHRVREETGGLPDDAPAAIPEDIATLRDMLVYLGQHATPPVVHASEPLVHDPPLHWYTCRHLLPSGDCGNYERRPRMCRFYPYGDACRWADCAWDAAREGRVLDLQKLYCRTGGHVHLAAAERAWSWYTPPTGEKAEA